MFATILGGLPRPPLPDDASTDELVNAAIRAQEDAGLEPLTDGRLRWRSLDGVLVRDSTVIVDAWRRAAAMTDRAVKACLPGPYSLAVRRRKRENPVELAITIRAHAFALAEAGCPFVEIEETEAHRIGDDAEERASFRKAHQRLLQGGAVVHHSLAIVGGNADTAGAETILNPGYASLAVDLIAGPDNWRLVSSAAPGVGIVAGVMAATEGAGEGPELILYAARYAASTQGRGLTRVGVAIVPGLNALPWEIAVRKMNALGHAARVAALPPGDELADAVDPRSIDIRTAAMGRRRNR